jgi:hypothetical protein
MAHRIRSFVLCGDFPAKIIACLPYTYTYESMVLASHPNTQHAPAYWTDRKTLVVVATYCFAH